MNLETDVLVIGSGIAGLTFSLKMAKHASVLLITKKAKAETSTNYARGGIAAVLGDDDELALHVEDTLSAGAGLCHRRVVELLVREGPARVRELMAWGAEFHREGDHLLASPGSAASGARLSLGKEGGHSRRRILHAGDQTGQEIERALLQAVEEEPSLRVLEDHLAIDLLLLEDATGRPHCAGALALDHRLQELVEVRARATMLATGGCGQVYRHTTNPPIATGDGVAMAYRAGAQVANMEFIQFHPTALYPTEDPAFLISEALRGEGAVLRRLDGHDFMEDYHPLGSLAPRDIVARAIDRELRESGDTHVLLDVSPIPRPTMESRFPGAVGGCLSRSVDLFGNGIPVVPAAHYLCGGVRTDDQGRTTLPELYAAGEVACTGVHGANRLASNSLLEAVVFSHRAAQSVQERLALPGESGAHQVSLGTGGVYVRRAVVGALRPPKLTPVEGTGGMLLEGWTSTPPRGTATAELTDEVRRVLRSVMWEYVGIVRNDALLEEAEHEVTAMSNSWDRSWSQPTLSPESVELRNLLQTAELIVRCARLRAESRGLHYNVDHPWRDSERYLRDTVLRP